MFKKSFLFLFCLITFFAYSKNYHDYDLVGKKFFYVTTPEASVYRSIDSGMITEFKVKQGDIYECLYDGNVWCKIDLIFDVVWIPLKDGKVLTKKDLIIKNGKLILKNKPTITDMLKYIIITFIFSPLLIIILIFLLYKNKNKEKI
jgi:hypothetical protein